MRIEAWEKIGDSGDGRTTVTTVTLAKHERHEWHRFVSRGAGHVFAIESAAGQDWTEYDAGDPVFQKRCAAIVNNGFTRIASQTL